MATNDVPELQQLALRSHNDLVLPANVKATPEELSLLSEVLDPNETIFDSPEHTHQALCDVGYLTTEIVSTNIFFAARMNKPLILEGPAGAGKTELALSVAKAEKMRLIRFQCYEGISDKQAMGDYNRALQEMFVLLQSKNQTCSWDRMRAEIVGRSYFMPGPLLEALESTERVVLLIDELDKVDHAFEATLLEILSVWQMSVPQMGTISSANPPFTVITSNHERHLGYPILRRAIYLPIEHPTAQVEAAIVARKTPELSHELHCFIAGFGKALRAYPMEKSPSISEIVDLAKALSLLGRTTISPTDKDVLLPLIAKTDGDRKKLLMKSTFENMIDLAGSHYKELMAPNPAPTDIVIPKAKAKSVPMIACEVITPPKVTKKGWDAWDMRNALRLSVWVIVAFFAISVGAQQSQSVKSERPPEMVYYANAYADYYHVPREIVYAVITHESGWKAKAVSNMGAMGLMQLMPATAAYYSVSDPFDVSQNIGAGVHYLADLIAKLNDWRLAIAGYYCGPTYPLMRGLEYANKDVVQYVNAIQRLYTHELSISPTPEVSPTASPTEPIQQDTQEVTP